MKQTAVEWLAELIECGADLDLIKKSITKAKEIEKQQIIDAYNKVSMNTGEQYYNETFNK